MLKIKKSTSREAKLLAQGQIPGKWKHRATLSTQAILPLEEWITEKYTTVQQITEAGSYFKGIVIIL